MKFKGQEIKLKQDKTRDTREKMALGKKKMTSLSLII